MRNLGESELEVIKENYLENLKDLVLRALEGENIKIFLFGSRARGDNYTGSDVDVGLLPVGNLNRKKIMELRFKIENSNIPYKVEFINFNEVSEDFKVEAMKKVIIWKD